MTDDQIVAHILGELDRNITPQIKPNTMVVNDFVSKVQEQFGNSDLYPSQASHYLHQQAFVISGINVHEAYQAGVRGNILHEAHQAGVRGSILHEAYKADVMHGGSAYEALSVKVKTDFDIIILLSDPYVGKNFEVERDSSGFFRLKWKPPRHGYLDAVKLQKQAFEELSRCVDIVTSRKMVQQVQSVKYKEGLAALDLEITTRDGRRISVDLAAQIAVREWKGADLVRLKDLPQTLQMYIDKLQRNGSPIYFISPSVPGRHVDKTQLCNISFSMLEKEFLRSHVEIRDMVRMVKLVGLACDWKKKFTLKSFYIKRLAVKFSDELQHQTKWAGYRLLLQHLRDELQQTNTIDGFFVHGQVLYKKKPEKIQEFCRAINEALSWNSQQVYDKVKIFIK
ncbi:uncharacterized protein [Cherax quadricarinatus]|uniref:uncharacterized protein n=1 Tax=Cherax quadricarinatus TaxID=27406 RepID=UPI00387EBA2A